MPIANPELEAEAQQLVTLLDVLETSKQNPALRDKLDDIFKMYRLLKP
jgi:hypothetical protein